MADKDNWLLALGASRRYTDLSTTSGLQSINTVELPNGTVVLRCIKTDGTIVDLPMNGLLTSLQKAWVQEHYDKLAYNNVTNRLEYDGEPIQSIIEEDIISTVDCGEVKVGDIIPQGLTLTEFAKRLLVKEVAPKIEIISDLDYEICYERGVVINPTLTITVKKNNPADSDIKLIELMSDPTNVDYDMVDNAPNPTTNTIVKTLNLSENIDLTVEALNINGKKGSQTINFMFVDPIYCGAIDENKTVGTVTEADILDAANNKILEDVDTTKELTEFYNVDMKKMFIAYPKSLGQLASIKDGANGFELITGFEKGILDVTTADGTIVPYYYYLAVVRSKIDNFEVYFAW